MSTQQKSRPGAASCSILSNLGHHGLTWKATLLKSVPLAVVTSIARSPARRHLSFNVGVGFDFERSQRPIKPDARCARQIVPQNDHSLLGAAKVRVRPYERTESQSTN